MEILAGVESPEADKPLRMDLQVRRLSDGMTAGQRQSLREEAQALQLEWFGLGPVEQPDDKLDARFRAAQERL